MTLCLSRVLMTVLLSLVLPFAAHAAARVNLLGSPAGTALTISTIAVQVVAVNQNRSYVVIQNTSANTMNCIANKQGTPSATIGVPVPGNQQLRFDGQDAHEAYSCIRAGSSDATAVIIESLP